MCSRLTLIRKSFIYYPIFFKSSCLPVLCLEKLCSAKHTFSKLRARHGKIRKVQMFTHRCFFYPHTYQTQKHRYTRKHTVEVSVFHRQVTSIRDPVLVVMTMITINPNMGFCLVTYCALHPIFWESVFNIMHGTSPKEQHYMGPTDQV